MQLLILLTTLAVLFSTLAQASSELCEFQPTSTSKCFDCTLLSAGECGWCAPTLQCLKGNSSGPTGGTCSIGWYFMVPVTPPVSNCPNCNSSRSCLQCNQNPECAWCGSDSTCYDLDSMPPTCLAVHDAGCPCEERTQCSDCEKGPSCVFCSKPQFQCVSASAGTCKQKDQVEDCSCDSFTDCNSCQAQEPCFWCGKSKSCLYYNETTCTPTQYCPSKSGGFDGGSYFGGMMTVVGIIGLVGIAYFAFRYYQEQRTGYEDIGR